MYYDNCFKQEKCTNVKYIFFLVYIQPILANRGTCYSQPIVD